MTFPLQIVAKIFARSPPAILLALGGVGVLIGIGSAWFLVLLGVLLQGLWLLPRFL